MEGKDTGHKGCSFMKLCAKSVSHGDYYANDIQMVR